MSDAALWWLADDERISENVVALLGEPRHEVLLSAAVVWEVAVKRSLGKLDAPEGFADAFLGSGASALPVTVAHASAVGGLPWHHRDPFGRMLVAQGTIEGAVLLTCNDAFASYDVRTSW